MKLLGISALAMTGLSLVLWFINWVLMTFFLGSYGIGSPVRYAGQTASFLSAVTEFAALAILGVGLIAAGNRPNTAKPQANDE